MVLKRVLFALLVVVALLAALAGIGQAAQPAAPAALAGSAFTYQGRLIRNNQPVNGTCALSLSLWDSPAGGAFLNSNTFPTVPITNGLFTVALDYGASGFNGQALYIESAVQCAGDVSYVTLSPRTPLRATPYALYALNNWGLGGNANTGGNGFVGTTDNTGLTIGVNGSGAIRIYPQSQSPNLVGGYSGNVFSPTLYGQTIAGGGSFFYENQTLREYGTVGGGRKNHADGYGATIAGGIDNWASNDYATVAGGLHNYATGSSSAIGGGFYNLASGYVSYVGGGDLNHATTQNGTIGGGYSNTVAGGQLIANNTIGGGVFNYNSGFAATIAGGHGNRATGEWATMGGGGFNTASGGRSATVSGGEYNVAAGGGSTIGGGGWNGASTSGNKAYGGAATIGGGFGNYLSADAGYGTIGGGQQNVITAAPGSNLNIATIGGGYNNKITLGGATIGGGNSNTVNAFDGVIAGGINNTVNGSAAAVPGGSGNTASGYASFAAGQQANADSAGCFVWNDNTNTQRTCNGANRFVARSSGGVWFFTSSNDSTYVTVAPGSGSWSGVSDRNAKTNFGAVDGREVLARVAALSVSTWNYKAQDADIRHIGPMAQDFFAAFGVGEDDKHISMIDADGVALAAIQGLAAELQERDARIAAQGQQIAALAARLDSLQNAPARAGAFADILPLLAFGFIVPALVVAGAFATGWAGARRAARRLDARLAALEAAVARQ